MQSAAEAWRRATLALAVLAVDTAGVGGLWLRARPGPARQAALDCLAWLPGAPARVHPGITEEALFGGIDLAATLSAARVVRADGLLARNSAVVLTMAERCPPRLAAHLGAARDETGMAVIALDEGTEDECPPAALTERLGLFLALDGIPAAEVDAPAFGPAEIAKARSRLDRLSCAPDQIEALVVSAARLGIGSMRAPLFAAAAARAIAALFGRDRVTSDDLGLAAELVYAHRATAFPEDAPENIAEPPGDPAEGDGSNTTPGEAQPPEEMLIEASAAALPADVLALLAQGRASRATRGASGAGLRKRGNRRGRPLPSRPGRMDGQSRIDLVSTLRAAAPWQPLRKGGATATRVQIRREDIRLRRFEERSDRLLVFAVDASGSAAMARLAETKGAIEILLGEAYSRRDHVALVAFRGRDAETLLPPTRSLVQTKRRLQALPGGGGTPLASGLMAAYATAEAARARGLSPTIALLTDGRGNIALDGRADRAAAAEDCETVARLIRVEGIPVLVIDTAQRPQATLAALSAALGAAYVALPRADARRLSDAVRDAAPA